MVLLSCILKKFSHICKLLVNKSNDGFKQGYGREEEDWVEPNKEEDLGISLAKVACMHANSCHH